jgi:hypothetical protein
MDALLHCCLYFLNKIHRERNCHILCGSFSGAGLIRESILFFLFGGIISNANKFLACIHQSGKSYFLSARKIKRDGYERYHASIGVVDDLRDLADKLKGFGLLGLLLVVLVDAIAEFYESTTKMELAIALWEAEREKQYAEIHRRRYLESTSYFPEVLDNMWKEKQKSGMEIQRLISEVLDNNEKPREKLSTIESCIKSDIPKIER